MPSLSPPPSPSLSKSSWTDYSNPSDSPRASLIPAFPRDRALIEYCTNEWRKDGLYASSGPHFSIVKSRHERCVDRLDNCVDGSLLVVRSPRFRRLLLALAVLILAIILVLVSVVYPWLEEERLLWRSLDADPTKARHGLYGSSVRPHFAGMRYIQDLEPQYLPSQSQPKRRLIFVGDIHGCKAELVKLMEKVGFSPETDHLIAVGDVVNKGPDTAGVIDYLMANNASSVRGNHEDTLLLHASHVLSSSGLRSQNGRGYHIGQLQPNDALAKVIRQLSQDQIDWLQSLPVVLRVGGVGGIADIVVVHAGLVPGVPIEAQDPFSIMNMRTIDLGTHLPSKFSVQVNGVPWFRLWGAHQLRLTGRRKWKSLTGKSTGDLENPALVVYGHDSRQGLQIGTFHKGLDSGCVNGGYLTGLVVSNNGHEDIAQVDCRHYIKHHKNT